MFSFEKSTDGAFILRSGEDEFRIGRLMGDDWTHWRDRYAVGSHLRAGLVESGNLRADEAAMDSLVGDLVAYDLSGSLTRTWVEQNLSGGAVVQITDAILAAHA